MDPSDAEAMRAGLAEGVRRELGDRRGYELVPREQALPAVPLDAAR